LEVDLFEISRGEQTIVPGRFEGREGKTFENLLLKGLQINQYFLVGIQSDKPRYFDRFECEVAVPLQVHNLLSGLNLL
jgi:hypothetical protein